MFSLQSLRNAHRLTRFVLVWFALFVGAAVASPLEHTALDCPACLPLIAPPVADMLAPLPSGNLSHVLQPLPAARLAGFLGQPWQARAPPIFSA
jgi:hypothetical protein